MKRIMIIVIASVFAVCCPLFAYSEGAHANMPPDDDILALFEAQLPWDDFGDMSAETLAGVISEIGFIADAYAFSGRESASGEYAYVIGALTQETSPFEGLSSWGMMDDRGRYIERFIYGETGDTAFEIAGVTVLRGLEAKVIIVIPEYCAAIDAGALYTHVLSGDAGYLADACARGVKLLKPEAPYLCVQLFSEGEYRKEYIPLNKTQVNYANINARAPYPPAVIGDYAIYMVDDERTADQAHDANASVPAYYVELAQKKCGFRVASPGDIGEIVSATFTVKHTGRAQTITDADALNEIRSIFKSAWYSGLSGCPYTGVLTLAMADGSEVTIHKATDSCPTLVFGSYAGYEITKEANERFWEIIFDEVNSTE